MIDTFVDSLAVLVRIVRDAEIGGVCLILLGLVSVACVIAGTFRRGG